MGVVADFLLYVVYLFAVFFISVWLKHRLKSDKKIVVDFYNYTKKGHQRVPHVTDSLLFFAVLQLLYPIPAIFAAAYLYGTPAYLSFILWFIASALLFYPFALLRDHVKKHRHNGIPVGYEYPHPIHIFALS